MKRIIIIGNAGAGKTTFTNKLAVLKSEAKIF